MREESWPTSKQRGIRLRLVHPSGVRRWDRRSPSVVCRHSFPAEPRQTTQNDGLSHSAFFSSRAKTDHAKRWSVQVCPTRHSFPAEPRQTTQNDGLSHSAFFSSRAKTDHAKRWSVQVCPTRHSFPAEPRQTTQNDGLSHSAFFSSRAKTDHAKR